MAGTDIEDMEWSPVGDDDQHPIGDPIPVELVLRLEDGEHLPEITAFPVTRDTIICLQRPEGAEPYPQSALIAMTDEIARVVQHPAFVIFEVIGGRVTHANTKDQSWASILKANGLHPDGDATHVKRSLAKSLRDLADQIES